MQTKVSVVNTNQVTSLKSLGAAYVQDVKSSDGLVFQISGNLILRVPILYGPLEFLDESAVTTLFRAVQDVGKDCKMNSVQRRFPTHTSDVAMVVRDLVKLKTKVSPSGVTD